jgi:cytochrome b561
MTDLPADSSGRLLISRLHTLGGATLMLLTVARLVVRRRGPAVTPLPVSDLHRRGVGVIHALLYAVTFGIGASGFVTGARSAWPDYLRGQLAKLRRSKRSRPVRRTRRSCSRCSASCSFTWVA